MNPATAACKDGAVTGRVFGLTVDPALRSFVDSELLPGLGLSPDRFWRDFADLIDDLTPENQALIEQRQQLQKQIDAYHQRTRNRDWDARAYRRFLTDIGYLEEADETVTIDTANVDAEIATIAAPQLVVPLSNARFALNAANARWGSLYDALYGTDVIPKSGRDASAGGYDPQRGGAVIAYAAAFLDQALPLADGSHADVTRYAIELRRGDAMVSMRLSDGTQTGLKHPGQFVGSAQRVNQQVILFRNNGLHVEICIDDTHPVGRSASAGVCDVILEAAVTTIQDCEDSVAAVDADDKVAVYRNWLGLMRGTLETEFRKGQRTVVRRLNDDRQYTGRDGNAISLPGRSLLLVRNVGHLMRTPAVLDATGAEVFEGLLDAVMTTACAMYDLNSKPGIGNSRTGSIYIVKPKMHGPREAAFADKLFARVEDLFRLDRYTIKMGVMDEERRTSVNLQSCIREVRHRLAFINTGFLDRTGDEIHTSMEAGPVLPKAAIKAEPWIAAYEDRNVDIGIRCGLPGRAQIGKGMWPKPDEMREMVATKQSHPESGASCAWVPSPTAATLHAMHYHRVDVAEVQRDLAERPAAPLSDILTPPIAAYIDLTPDEIQHELDNNAQGILGYVVRWIDQGIGCSKVPDINDTYLMEDRATLRISSQHIANWLRHGVCTKAQVVDTFRRMAAIVDAQNADDPAYLPMAPGFDGIAFRAACELALRGCEQPNGYTEPLLHARRAEFKRQEVDA
ncbi:MAG: malate synthase G [Pseudomonadota bacterium]